MVVLSSGRGMRGADAADQCGDDQAREDDEAERRREADQFGDEADQGRAGQSKAGHVGMGRQEEAGRRGRWPRPQRRYRQQVRSRPDPRPATTPPSPAPTIPPML